MDNFKVLQMKFNYRLASNIIDCFNSSNISEEIDMLGYIHSLNSKDIIKKTFEIDNVAIKPLKYTLLHSFCEQYLYFYLMNEKYYLIDELCDDLDAKILIEHISSIVSILDEYGVFYSNDYIQKILVLDNEYKLTDYSNEKNYRCFIKWLIDDILVFFDKIELDIVDSVFYLLFNNKNFLFKFNSYLAEYVNSNYLGSDCFNNYKHIKRLKYISKWLQKGVLYRDNGKCQHCGKELSGLLTITKSKELHLEHIIPLEKGGTNDATNFQILCDNCNLKKGDKLYMPNYKYQMYW
ncbi:hypothetical protein M2475_000796 [Breznakia sp. PF5-3]|uniref:HNH endonuclease n=1 Tax=unclassified Breznakia TaxID=2623764 RepID=UPI0024070A8A|nr:MULTISPECIES: HNH endonuclease [unclassified Breznakia]MDF9824486.1 hypothetical protein [Breznakia sp. PM6-1]MDF9835231.1 hypothetical protein [Breznakia sp. PF5-3]MDF9837441.1 hypothetical protein [Breznakia sp. PFB2-8]MDF9859377.1 hypothetical protein [Breznakia sp. PH5-24]